MPSNFNEQAVEMYLVTVGNGKMGCFLQAHEIVGQFLSTLPGYVGTEILLMGEHQLLILIRWNDSQKFEEMLPTLLQSSVICDWMQLAVSVRQQPVISKFYRGR